MFKFRRSHLIPMLLAAVLGLGLSLVGMDLSLPWLGSVTSVRSLQHRQGDGRPIPVRLQGQVGETIPLVNAYAYELQDDTGTLWVLSSTTPPPRGTRIHLTGQARFASIPVGNQEQGEFYVEEQTRNPAPEE